MSHDSALICKVRGNQVGIPLTFAANAWPSKANVLKWYFSLIKATLSSGGTSVAIRPLPSSGGLSPPIPGVPGIAPLPTLTFIGSIPSQRGNNSGSNVVSSPQSVDLLIGANYGYNYPSGPWVGGKVIAKLAWVNSRVGVDLPKWRSMVKNGVSATTSMSAVRYELSIGGMSHLVSWQRVGVPAEESSGFSCYVNPVVLLSGYTDSLLESNTDNRALGKLHDRLAKLHQDARIGESLGEYAQAIRMLSGPLDGFRRGWAAYQRSVEALERKFQSRAITYAAYIDALAALWLELVFGWQPLIYDINDVINSIMGKRAAIKSKISASWRDDKQVMLNQSSYTTSNYCVRRTQDKRKLIVTVRYQVGVRPEKVPVKGQLERLGLTPRELIPTLYAVTPYSWLFDYFTSLNNVIDALCADISFVTWSAKTVRRESVVEISDSPDHAASAASTGVAKSRSEGTAGLAVATRHDVVRSIPSSLVPNPTLTVPVNGRQLANIAALLAIKFAKPLGHGPLLEAERTARKWLAEKNLGGRPVKAQGYFPLA